MQKIVATITGIALVVALSIAMPSIASAQPTTVIVNPSDLILPPAIPSTGQFEVLNQSGGQGTVGIVSGPATPPAGTGSLQLTVTGPADHWSVYNYDHLGTKLSDITTLGYSTYTDNNTLDPGLQMEIDPGNTTGTDAGVTYSTLNFEPYLQSGGETPNIWQTWNVLSGVVWGTHLTGATEGTPISWSDFIATYPNATITGGFGANVGSGYSAVTGNVNELTIGTATTTDTYIFEPGGISSLQMTTTSLSPGAVKTAYSETLAATGGDPPYKWSIASGALPKGLRLNRSTGVIAGTPKTSGTFIFTVKVVDKRIKRKGHPATQNTATKALSITVS